MVFAANDAVTKILTQSYAIGQILMVRYLVFTFCVLLYFAHEGRLRHALRSSRPWIQIARSLMIVAQTALIAFGLRYLGMAELHALFATSPLMATALAAPLLAEQVRWRRWASVLLGFLGTLIILRPGVEVFDPAAIVPLAAAGTFALYNLMTRMTGLVDPAETSLLYMALAGSVAMTIFGSPLWQAPDLRDWGMLVVLAFGSLLGHYLLIKALQLAPASALQPFNYSLLVWATVIGFLVFGDLPDVPTIVGAMLIVAGGCYVIWRERETKPERGCAS